jgi:hypothetical protein
MPSLYTEMHKKLLELGNVNRPKKLTVACIYNRPQKLTV